jgi:retron-type reverse transcriptase
LPLQVTPATNIAASGTQGGPFSPLRVMVVSVGGKVRIKPCRDDGLVHCRTEAEAAAVKAKLAARFAECHLEMHPDKTKIVYCKDAKRKSKYPNTRFDFLG